MEIEYKGQLINFTDLVFDTFCPGEYGTIAIEYVYYRGADITDELSSEVFDELDEFYNECLDSEAEYL